VLMSVIVVTLNPAEMLKKTRDTKRISDLDAVRTAINLYLADVGSLSGFNTGHCYLSDTTTTGYGSGIPGCSTLVPTSSPQLITGSGWVPLNFNSISSGAPLSSLPLDPNPNRATTTTTSGWRVYVFKGSTASSTYKLMANMESSYYSNGGPGDVESKDGGIDPGVYEVGSDVTGL